MSTDSAVDELGRSQDMSPVEGTVEVAIPASELWNIFQRPDLWPRWNSCFYWVRNHGLVQGSGLVWIFQPIRPYYLYKMPATAQIVEASPDKGAIWHVTSLPGFFARHAYSIEPVSAQACRFGSWEKAMGPTFRLARGFWLAHFRFVLNRSLEGARLLESIYLRDRRLVPEALPAQPWW